jgi:hypothetical protein
MYACEASCYSNALDDWPATINPTLELRWPTFGATSHEELPSEPEQACFCGQGYVQIASPKFQGGRKRVVLATTRLVQRPGLQLFSPLVLGDQICRQAMGWLPSVVVGSE